jgi:hypothetical protein
MPVLGNNICTPPRVYGPLSQTLFCGCSVKNYSISAGWNEQSSSMTIELVEDTCSGNKFWWDENLDRQTGNIVDPGFSYPEPGCAAYFRFEENPEAATEAERGGFEYAGLIESWNESRSAQGNPTYTVKLTDPRSILENTQVIVGDYAGGTSGVYNIINAYGFVETFGNSCDISSTNGFGGTTLDNALGSIYNERGMVWPDVKCAIHTLTSSLDKVLANTLYSQYCVENRLVYVGPRPGTEGYGIIKGDGILSDVGFQLINNANLIKQEYLIDISEIPFTPEYYRIMGPNISLMELISQVCKDAGCDYYIELLPVKVGNSILKVIKIRVALRAAQPQTGKLDTFIAAKDDGEIISYTKGEEVRNEETSIFLKGGKRKDPYYADQTQILPFWGVDADGNLIAATVSSGEYYVNLDFSTLNPSLTTSFSSRYNAISESEMRAALYDIDSWKSVTLAKGGAISGHLESIKQNSSSDLSKVFAVLKGSMPPFAPTKIPVEDSQSDHIINSAAAKDLDKIYSFVRSYADEYYGKQFLVNAPFLCMAVDSENNIVRYSHEPSTDGCWVEDSTSTVLGLAHNSAASDFFRDSDGKYQAILGFPSISGYNLAKTDNLYVSDPSKLGNDDYISSGPSGVGSIWVKADIDERWVHGTPLSPSSSTSSFLLKTSAPITHISSNSGDLTEPFGAVSIILEKLNAGEDVFGAWSSLDGTGINVVDRGSISMGAINAAVMPAVALAPTTSHLETYGPWGLAGLPGQVVFDNDEGFVPWEYGSDLTMNNAALDRVTNAVTQMRKGERGNVVLASVPNIPIGAELFSVDATIPPNSQGSQKYVGTRAMVTTACTTILPYVTVPMNAWTGAYGPNITQINVTIGTQGFTTEYQFSTYTPQFGRFNKGNAEKLKRAGQEKLKLNRNLRSKAAEKSYLNRNAYKKPFADFQTGRTGRVPKSAHHFMMGRYTTDGRPEVHSMPAKEAAYSIQSDDMYRNMAMVSSDAFFRPFTTSGDGRLATYVATGDLTNTFGAAGKTPDPPINEYSRIKVASNILQPYANPSGDLTSGYSDTPGTGHDIQAVGRGTGTPPNYWTIQESESESGEGYSSVYRPLALKGPIVITQWGYDKNNKPIPNLADDETSIKDSGVYTDSGLQDKFLDGWLQKPATWPTAPLDLKLDRERGVWTIPSNFRLIKAEVNADIDADDSGNATPININPVYDADGSAIESPTITVSTMSGNMLSSGDIITVYYDDNDNVYYPITAAEGGQARFITFILTSSLTSLDSEGIGAVSTWWHGSQPTGSLSAMPLHNPSAGSAGGYIFEGDVGVGGIAVYDDVNENGYVIIQLACDPDPSNGGATAGYVSNNDSSAFIAGTTMGQYRLTLDGIRSGISAPECSSGCEDMNGTYFLSQSGTSSTWVYDPSGVECGVELLTLEVSQTGTDSFFEATLHYNNSGSTAVDYIQWGKTVSGYPTDGSSMDHVLQLVDSSGTHCRGTASTARISAF